MRTATEALEYEAQAKVDALRNMKRQIDPACASCRQAKFDQYMATDHRTIEKTICTSAVCKGQLEYVEVSFNPGYPTIGDSHKVSRRCPDGYVSEGNFVSNRTPPDVDWMSDEDSSFVAYRPDLSPTPKIDKDKPQVDIDFW